MSHGDLAHTGLYAYAHTQWGLTAPAYTTLPVQAMARIAATEDGEGVRDEENIDEEPSPVADVDGEAQENSKARSQSPEQRKSTSLGTRHKKYVATVHEVHEAFDSVNVLRYSQPCHLQGLLHQLRISYDLHVVM